MNELHQITSAGVLALDGGMPQTWTGFIGPVIGAGSIIGAVIAFLATRAERKKIGSAHAETNKVYEQTIAAQKNFIDTLKEGNAREIADMTTERDSYRKRSHDLAGELQACSLKIKDYEMRPDLTTLYHAEKTWHEQREKFYIKMFDGQEQILSGLKAMLGILQALSKTVELQLKKNGGAA